jgi:hypothetical protein
MKNYCILPNSLAFFVDDAQYFQQVDDIEKVIDAALDWSSELCGGVVKVYEQQEDDSWVAIKSVFA